MNKLIKELKENDQDYEFYPTTDEIIQVLKKNIQRFDNTFRTILDIGAGNGKVLSALDSEDNAFKKYAIEKSKILIEIMNKDIFIVGTDFNEQTLIDKKVDIIFSNPPYSEYEPWTCKIIKEANAGYIYLVIPERWENQESILDAIKLRDAQYKIIGNFDFLESADRRARAKVQLVRIDLKGDSYHNNNPEKDPFDIWFNENFKFEADEFSSMDYEKEKQKSEELKSLILRKNLIASLAELYKKELSSIIENYRLLEKLDSSLFKELNVSISQIKEGLKLRIEGLKNLYWKELFDNLDKIIDRLTYSSRDKLLNTLLENTGVDFTAGNAYSVIIWAIKNANEYYDKQLLDLYMKISDPKNVRNYKSNKRIIEDGWRYDKRQMSHYSLDYRIVHNFYNAIENNSWRNDKDRLSRDAVRFIQDIFTIANNLGFEVSNSPDDFHWYAGKPNYFYLKDNTLFVEIKAFKNGNLHFKFMPKFMKKLNLEAGRLNGWIKTTKQASGEFDITEIEAEEMFKGNFILLPKNMLMIEGIN